MPRKPYTSEPYVINTVKAETAQPDTLEFATGNENKLREFQRILSHLVITAKSLHIEEIQSLDPYKVARHKAIEAYKANGNNPIMIEETSLSLMGLGGRPGPYIKDFSEDIEMRRMIAESWLKGRDRRAVAMVLIALYDGAEVQLREGKLHGTIAETLRGTNGFGWDDMFIPEGETRTLAEMTGEEKDHISHRRKALEALRDQPFQIRHAIVMIDEPYEQELVRVNKAALQDEQAIRFAYTLETLGEANPPDPDFSAPNYIPIAKEENIYYTRYFPCPDSDSLGLLLTDVDRKHLQMHHNGQPLIMQFGPERRSLALAQRADFFIANQSEAVHSILDAIETGETVIPLRSDLCSATVESVLGLNQNESITSTYSFKDLGYKKQSSGQLVSRTKSAEFGLFNKIGKYPRSIYSIGSMPAISGWRDVLVTAAIGHHAIFTHRNSLLAGYVDRQVALINSAKDALRSLNLSERAYQRAERNIGAAIGCSNIEAELETVKTLYEDAGVRLFRIYTINSDPRVIETAAAIRQTYGDDVELFVGQISDKAQAFALIAPDVRVDGLFFGHGGGRQCTSAVNGMAVTTLEEVYSIVTDDSFQNTTIAVEGGVGTHLGHLFLLGVDLISYNQQFAHCVIEQGDIYFVHNNGKICMPYHGSASAPTMIIESANPALAQSRLRPGGRTRNVEGKAGYRFFEQKANSMGFYLNTFKHYAARMLADLGVESFAELRQFMRDNEEDLIRVVSSQASAVADAYRNTM